MLNLDLIQILQNLVRTKHNKLKKFRQRISNLEKHFGNKT